MVQMLDELETECLLTKDGGYRLFGYDLDAIREYDLYLNGGRTHIERPHECLRARKVHGSLGVRYSGKAQCHQRRSNDTDEPGCMGDEQRTCTPDLRKDTDTVDKFSVSVHWHLNRLGCSRDMPKRKGARKTGLIRCMHEVITALYQLSAIAVIDL
jgi:hypothetical protein